MRTLARPVALAVAALLLAGCGSEGSDDSDAAVDPTPSSATGTPDPPIAEPTVGSYPSFAPEDYTYTLHVTCFCVDAETGIRVTVEDGRVTEAVYAESGRGVREGDEADAFRRLTINDVIDAANNTQAARVDVTWPAGQEHPSKVYVDKSERIVDEEVGYLVADVNVG